jgi:hypothetical protein
MTEQEREELIEKMAKAAWESDGAESWEKARETGRKSYLRESRAALAVAEPVIREECAKIIEPSFPRPCDCETCYCGNRDDADSVAAWDEAAANAKAIREGWG